MALALLASHSVPFLSKNDWQSLFMLMSFSLIGGIALLTVRRLQIRIAHLLFLAVSVILAWLHFDVLLGYAFFVALISFVLSDQLSLPLLKTSLLLIGLMECTTGILQYANLLPGENGFTVCGHFNNPSGFAAFLVGLLPFTFACAQSNNRGMHCITIATRLIFIVAIFLSNSRAGMLSACVILLIIAYRNSKLCEMKRSIKAFVILVIVVGLTIGLYFLKQDSANGRLLIWSVSWEMFKDAPLTGHGAGSFLAQYMEYQADYLMTHPDSPYALLAADVKVPFNEYIKLLVEFGLLGFIAVCVLVLYLWREYKRSQDPLKASALQSLIGIAVFAFFSYPSEYFCVILILLFDIAIICRDSCSLFLLKREKLLIHKLILTPLIGWMFVSFLMEIKQEKELYNLAYASQQSDLEARYEKLYATKPRNICLVI